MASNKITVWTPKGCPHTFDDAKASIEAGTLAIYSANHDAVFSSGAWLSYDCVKCTETKAPPPAHEITYLELLFINLGETEDRWEIESTRDGIFRCVVGDAHANSSTVSGAIEDALRIWVKQQTELGQRYGEKASYAQARLARQIQSDSTTNRS